MIEGIALENQNSNRIKRLDIHDQVDFVTRNYPRSDKINTLYILGNHDYRCLNEGIDISKILEHRRLDMHFLGYKNSSVKIGQKMLLLHHPFTIENNAKYDGEIRDLYFKPEFDLILRGHTHHNYIYVNDMDNIVVNVPALYDSPTRYYQGAYEVTLKDDSLELNSLIVDNELIVDFSSIKYPLQPKTLVKNNNSQVDKFNSRKNKSNR